MSEKEVLPFRIAIDSGYSANRNVPSGLRFSTTYVKSLGYVVSLDHAIADSLRRLTCGETVCMSEEEALAYRIDRITGKSYHRAVPAELRFTGEYIPEDPDRPHRIRVMTVDTSGCGTTMVGG